jgi:hypothetical protein
MITGTGVESETIEHTGICIESKPDPLRDRSAMAYMTIEPLGTLLYPINKKSKFSVPSEIIISSVCLCVTFYNDFNKNVDIKISAYNAFLE